MRTTPQPEFCPHDGVVTHEGSPATLAGEVAGDLPGRLRSVALLALGLLALHLLAAGFDGGLDLAQGLLGGVVGALSLGMIALSFRAVPPRTASLVGSAYLILTSLGIALAEQHAGMRGLSWNALWVAFFPLVVPCDPAKTFIKALLAATMTPLAFLLVVVVPGRPIPEPMAIAASLVPVYVAAILAHLGAKLIARIGDALSRARRVGRYELVRLLGEGGMGQVWEAEHRMLARPVAIKLVRGDADARKQVRFEREARATARLESPHTVRLYDFGVTEKGEMFYVMERLEGMDLEQLVRAHGPMAPERVVHVLKQALHSLEEAHARGLVHRDVKPANLHLGRQGLELDHLKVLDFGLVKPSPGAGSLGPTLTADDRISGTPAYLAPETVAGGREVDGRADVYALGCVAYYLLTGRRVFEGDDVLRVAVAHVTEEPLPPSVIRPGLDPDLEDVILAALEKDPARRPHAAELRRMLRALELAPWTQRDAARWWAHAGDGHADARLPVDPTGATRPALRLAAGHA